MNNNKKKVVVVGGGFGGISFIKNEKDDLFEKINLK